MVRRGPEKIDLDKSLKKKYNQCQEGTMWRLTRVVVITVAVFLIAWVIKEFVGGTDGKKADDLIAKIRLSGI